MAMKILRKGARADHGVKKVELKTSKLKWNATEEAFDLTFAGSAPDFSTDGRHIYKVRYTPAELASQLSMLADAATSMDAESSPTFSETRSRRFSGFSSWQAA
jgi:hypothetical protein